MNRPSGSEYALWASETLGYAAEALGAPAIGPERGASSTKRCSAPRRSASGCACPNCCYSIPYRGCAR